MDRAIEREVLRVMEAGALEAARAAAEGLAASPSERREALALALKLARSETERAFRQYNAVEPENRLVAADTARLGQPEINLGIIPGYGGTQRLPRLVGKGIAKLLIFTGDMISAEEALRLGLVDKVVPAAELMEAARGLARQLAAKAPVALALAKASINQGLEVDLERGCALEAANFAVICSTADRLEGTSAFLEKRKPSFKGR